jgi:ribose transport system permease protein
VASNPVIVPGTVSGTRSWSRPPRELLTVAGPLLALVVLFGVGAAVVQGFVSRDNFDSILVLSSFLGISAAGQTLVVIVGGIDLSVASSIGLGEVGVSVLYSQGMPLWQILLLLTGCSVVIGVVNGGVSSFFRVHPLIVSLGVGFMVSGGVLIWTSGGAVQGTSPMVFQQLTAMSSSIGPIPLPPILIVWLVVAVVLIVIQRRTTLGQQIYALGSNPEAARLALVPRNRVWIATYVISAFTGILTGVLLSGFSGGANFDIGSPYLFNSIAAVVVGGTSFLGGSGGYGRTIIGSLVVIEIGTILIGIGLDPALQESLLGVFIILVVFFAGREPELRTRI